MLADIILTKCYFWRCYNNYVLYLFKHKKNKTSLPVCAIFKLANYKYKVI